MNNNFIKEVIQLASDNTKKKFGGPFAAIIVKDNKAISCGFNNVVHKNDPTAHAEIDAIRKACKKLKTFNLKGCKIYSSCEPCPMCFSAIHWANIDTVYYIATRKIASKYGFKDEQIYRELKTKIVSVKMKKIDYKEEELPFKLWNNNKNKVIY